MQRGRRQQQTRPIAKLSEARDNYHKRIRVDDIAQATTEPVWYHLTPDKLISIENSLYYGANITVALQKSSVPSETYMQWQTLAINSVRPFVDIFLAFESAKADFEINHLKNLCLSATLDNKASTFLLERTKSQRYAQRSFINVEPGYITDLKQLISSGAATVDEILAEIGDVEEEYLTILYGLQAQRKAAYDKQRVLEDKMTVRQPKIKTINQVKE